MVLTPTCIYGQSTTLFHEFSPTASGWDVIEWNVKDTAGKTLLIKETVDSLNRVIELEFLNSGMLYTGQLCYLANRVTFDYIGNTIVEKTYSGNKALLGNPCQNYHKKVYFLDSQRFITKIEMYAEFDFIDMDSVEISDFKASFSDFEILFQDSSIYFRVDYYYHSFAKLNGIYPVSENYNIVEDYYYGNEPETSSIKKGLELLKNYH